MTTLHTTGPALTLPRRVERKYVLPQPRTRGAAAWLRHACRPAPEYATGAVSSCYFDTPSFDSYYESADGALSKGKVRLRWYDAWPASGSPAGGTDADADVPPSWNSSAVWAPRAGSGACHSPCRAPPAPPTRCCPARAN